MAAKTINASQRWLAQSEWLSWQASTVFRFRKILLLHDIEKMNFDTDKYGHRLLTMLQVGDDGWLGVERAIAQIIVRHERHWLVCRQEMVVVYLHQDGAFQEMVAHNLDKTSVTNFTQSDDLLIWMFHIMVARHCEICSQWCSSHHVLIIVPPLPCQRRLPINTWNHILTIDSDACSCGFCLAVKDFLIVLRNTRFDLRPELDHFHAFVLTKTLDVNGHQLMEVPSTILLLHELARASWEFQDFPTEGPWS